MAGPVWTVCTSTGNSGWRSAHDPSRGSGTFYQWPVLRVWTELVLWWTGFTVVLVFVLICLSVLVRPLWADRERLTFPIIQLPLELTNPETPLLRNRLLWTGFALAAVFDLANGLHTLFPAVPGFNPQLDLAAYLPDPPWSAVNWLPVTLYPSVIGLCFLMPLDLLFSCVAFFFYWKALYAIAAATGISRGYEGNMSEAMLPWVRQSDSCQNRRRIASPVTRQEGAGRAAPKQPPSEEKTPCVIRSFPSWAASRTTSPSIASSCTSTAPLASRPC